MIEAYKKFFINYANFTGVSSKSDYWWAVLCNAIISTALSILGNAASIFNTLGYIFSLGVMVPGIAICVRRLRDVGEKWSYIFMGLIPFAGPILLIVKLCQPSANPTVSVESAAAPVAPVEQPAAPVAPEEPTAPVVPETPVDNGQNNIQ